MLCFIYCSRLIIVTLDEEYPVYLVCVWKKLKNAVFFTIQFIFTTIYYTKSNKNITSQKKMQIHKILLFSSTIFLILKSLHNNLIINTASYIF